jgi:DNA primase
MIALPNFPLDSIPVRRWKAMARIPEEEIERLKREVSLRGLVEAAGVELARHGGNGDLVGRCVFHEEESPSLVVTESKGLFHCFGCGAGGDAIEWVRRTRGVSFRHAVELLREGGPLPLVAGPVKRSSAAQLGGLVEAGMNDAAMRLAVTAFYHETLKADAEALGYLEKRGLRSAEAIERFKLGYANRTLGYRLPEKSRVEGAELRGRLQALGFVRASGHEHFAGSLVVPIFDEAGQVAGMYGRKVHENLRAGTPRHLYLPGPHRGVWNWEALRASAEVVLCEALLDALTFWCAGYRNVTASYGVEGFTADHAEAFRRYGVERVLIAYDRDAAGDRAAEALAERLIGAGVECFRIQFPRGTDANAFALAAADPVDALGTAIRRAAWLGGQPSAVSPATPERSLPTPDATHSEESEEPPPAARPPLAAPRAAETSGPDAHCVIRSIVNTQFGPS